MAGLIMGGSILAALFFVLAKKLKQKRKTILAQQKPGLSFENPLPLSDFNDIKRFLRRTLCPHCEGDLRAMGEDTASVGAKNLHVVRTRCERCDEMQALVFDIGSLPN